MRQALSPLQVQLAMSLVTPHTVKNRPSWRWLLRLILTAGWLVLFAPIAHAGFLDLAWDAPTTNTDGTPLTDLAIYRVYFGTSSAPCLGSSFQEVTSPTLSPTPGDSLVLRLGGLTPGTKYFVQVTALDTLWRESDCSNKVSGVAKADPGDPSLPTVSITTPTSSPSYTTSDSLLTLEGTVTGNVAVTQVIWINSRGGIGTASGTMSWTASDIELQPGTTTFTVMARDEAGNTGSTVLIVSYILPPLSQGLVAAYAFAEGSGTTTADASGNGNTGILSGATWTRSGIYGNALALDGTNNWVTVNDAPSLDLTTGMTIMAWVYPTATPTDRTTVIFKEQTNGLVYSLYAGSPADTPSVRVITSSEVGLEGPFSIPINTWSHLASTYDATTLRLYVDGFEMAIQDLGESLLTSDGPLRFGGNGVFGQYFQGMIDEVRIYNRALSAAEIQAAMNAPVTPTLVSPTGMVSTTTPTYTWNAVSTSTWYYLWVNDSTGVKITQWYTAAEAGCRAGTGLCTVTPGTALSPGAGQWWIQTYGAAGNGPWSPGMIFTVTAPPAATLVSPTGPTNTRTPTYTWNAVSTSTWYYLWVNDSTGVKITQWYTAAEAGCASGTGTCTVAPSTALAQGAGQWWIQTYGAAGNGPWSSPLGFTVSPPPAATLVSPSGPINTRPPTYNWNAVSSATWYYLWVNDATGNRISRWYTAAETNCASGTGTCSVSPSTALAQGAGQWWIQTYGATGNGPWSSALSFSVSP